MTFSAIRTLQLGAYTLTLWQWAGTWWWEAHHGNRFLGQFEAEDGAVAAVKADEGKLTGDGMVEDADARKMVGFV